MTVFQRHNDRETRNKKFDVIEIALMKSKIVQIMKTSTVRSSLLPNKALERNAQSFMKRTIVACIGLGDEHWDTVSLIGRLSWGRFASAYVGDR